MNRSWKPVAVVDFVTDYLSGKSDYELSSAYGGSVDQVKYFLAYLRKHEDLPTRDELRNSPCSFEYKAATERKEFRQFLVKARTFSELKDNFGDLAEQLILEKHPGLNMFEQINNYGEKIYILLPEFSTEQLEVKPREWTFYQAPSDENESVQPYLVVQIPDSMFVNDGDDGAEIIVAPSFDVHLGHYAHKREKLLSYIRWIAETPNVLTYIGGDFTENALETGKGMTFSQDLSPQAQIKRACTLLAPIAHKLLFIQPGNHEDRSERAAGINPMEIVADYLGVPYYAGPVYCTILGKGHKWKIYSFHGNGNSQTKGGKLNAAGKPRRWIDFVNFIVSGHTHDPMVNNETCIVENPALCKLSYMTQWIVTCPSFLAWEGTYAYKGGMSPTGKGGVSLHMYATGEYEALLRCK